jgi:outer membrane receptor for ferrienterochelin and colicin
MTRKRVPRCLPAVLFCLASSSVMLEAVPAAAQQQIEEVTVTARKYQESFLETPAIETAISGAQLQQFQTNDLKSVETQVPDLRLGSTMAAMGDQRQLAFVGNGLNDTIIVSISRQALETIRRSSEVKEILDRQVQFMLAHRSTE